MNTGQVSTAFLATTTAASSCKCTATCSDNAVHATFQGENALCTGPTPTDSNACLNTCQSLGLNLNSCTCRTTSPYAQACQDAGITLPETFPSGPPSWTLTGTINSDDLQIDPGQTPSNSTPPNAGAELWTWTQGNTVCSALVRYSANKIQAIGVICYNTNNEKACFFDNRTQQTTNGSGSPPVNNIPGDFLSPPQAENCMACHSGTNPFIVSKSISQIWTSVPAGTNPFGPVGSPANDVVTSGSCTSCHALIKPASKSCDFVIFPALLVDDPPYMPPGASAGSQPGTAASSIISQCCSVAPSSQICSNFRSCSGEVGSDGDLGPCKTCCAANFPSGPARRYCEKGCVAPPPPPPPPSPCAAGGDSLCDGKNDGNICVAAQTSPPTSPKYCVRNAMTGKCSCQSLEF